MIRRFQSLLNSYSLPAKHISANHSMTAVKVKTTNKLLMKRLQLKINLC